MSRHRTTADLRTPPAVAACNDRQCHRPVLIEADDRLGGMAACFDFAGMQLERYYPG